MVTKNATLTDVARRAGVSKTTAASILRGDATFRTTPQTRALVQAAAAELKYRRNALAAALSIGHAQTIGIQLPLTSPTPSLDLGRDMFMALFAAACESNTRVMPIPVMHNRPLTAEAIVDGRVDGMVLASLHDRDLVESIYATGIPCVELGTEYGPHQVHGDNEGAMAMAVTHVVELGHRRIAYCSEFSRVVCSVERRLAGFRNAMEAAGLAVPPTFIIENDEDLHAVMRLPIGERPTAIVAYNDAHACRIVDIAFDLGLRIPQDLSVTGFDNNTLASACRPTLTTVQNPLDGQAHAALEILANLWAGAEVGEIRRIVPTELVVRTSTGPVPRQP